MQHRKEQYTTFFYNGRNISKKKFKESNNQMQLNAAPAYIGHFVEREGDGSGEGGLGLRAGDGDVRQCEA